MQPKSYYQYRLDFFNAKLEKLKKTLQRYSLWRSLVFLSILLCGYLVYENYTMFLAVLPLLVVLFLYLVVKHNRIKDEKKYTDTIIALNKKELNVLDGQWHALPNGKEYSDKDHYFSQDIDLFGQNSIFQYINRTVSEDGSRLLANLFLANDTSGILERQQAIKELGKLADWRQDFTTKGLLVKTEISIESMVQWLKNYRPFTSKIMLWGPIFFGIASIVAVVMFFTGLISGGILVSWFLVGLGISGIFVKRVSRIAVQSSKVMSVFQEYHKLIRCIEEQNFESRLLQKTKTVLKNNGEPTSRVIHRFGTYLSSLDQRNNILVSLFANGLFLKDLWECYRIEKWIAMYGHQVGDWFNVLTFFDAYSSLGNYAFNHPSHTYPGLVAKGPILKVENAIHPLLKEGAVRNDFTVEENHFLIITGANMAGKSTFLRTVCLLVVFANAGLPVSAESFAYRPIKLITSMRTTDSLAQAESYFYSELKRLQFITSELQKSSYLVVLDEILKGTNSKDKALGSKKLLEKLLNINVTGIIATHDLSLCEVANEHAKAENHYFDAQIIDGNLHFDYTLREGICKNMNASFLLKEMGIV